MCAWSIIDRNIYTYNLGYRLRIVSSKPRLVAKWSIDNYWIMSPFSHQICTDLSLQIHIIQFVHETNKGYYLMLFIQNWFLLVHLLRCCCAWHRYLGRVSVISKTTMNKARLQHKTKTFPNLTNLEYFWQQRILVTKVKRKLIST